MLNKLFHWVRGYAYFEVEGAAARFINIAVKSRLTLWDLRRKDGKAVGYIRAREYKKLRGISKRCGTKLKCLKKDGLPFYLNRLNRRKGLLIGIAASVFLYLFLSSFIWRVEIRGLENLTPYQVAEAARINGVYEGARKDGFYPAAAANAIKARIPEISWLSVNTDGCRVQIDLKEAQEKPDFADAAPSNIIAEREGVVVRVEVQTGMKQVKVGDAVEKDQVLITGLYAENVSPYTEKKVPIKHYALRARGSVIAETVRNDEVTIPNIQKSEVASGRKSHAYLIFFGIRIPLALNTAVEEDAHIFREEKRAEIFGQEIPLGILRENYHLYEIQSRNLSEEEMRQEALYQMRLKQKEEFDGRARILEEKLEYEFTESGCVLRSLCRLEEEIGVESEVLLDITDISTSFYQ